jgi:hypothetical protein
MKGISIHWLNDDDDGWKKKELKWFFTKKRVVEWRSTFQELYGAHLHHTYNDYIIQQNKRTTNEEEMKWIYADEREEKPKWEKKKLCTVVKDVEKK